MDGPGECDDYFQKIADTLALADYQGKDYYMGNYKNMKRIERP